MAVLESEILARAKAWGIIGTLTPTARMELGKQIQEERDAAAFALLNAKFVAATEKNNDVTAANTDALLSLETRMIQAIAALKPA